MADNQEWIVELIEASEDIPDGAYAAWVHVYLAEAGYHGYDYWFRMACRAGVVFG